MKNTVSDFLIKRITQWGIRRIYGFPGDGINGIITIAHEWKHWSDPCLIAMAGDPKFKASQVVPEFGFARYAELLGLQGIRVERPEDIGPGTEDEPFVDANGAYSRQEALAQAEAAQPRCTRMPAAPSPAWFTRSISSITYALKTCSSTACSSPAKACSP